jgi:hypothetical protein
MRRSKAFEVILSLFVILCVAYALDDDEESDPEFPADDEGMGCEARARLQKKTLDQLKLELTGKTYVEQSKVPNAGNGLFMRRAVHRGGALTLLTAGVPLCADPGVNSVRLGPGMFHVYQKASEVNSANSAYNGAAANDGRVSAAAAARIDAMMILVKLRCGVYATVLVALRDLRANAEVLINYGDSFWTQADDQGLSTMGSSQAGAQDAAAGGAAGGAAGKDEVKDIIWISDDSESEF